jgi:hypothetical protein
MAKGIQDIGIGLGYLYMTDPAGSTIIATQPNTVVGVKNMRQQGNDAAPFIANRPAVATITVNSVASTGAITAITIGGVNQIGSNINIATNNATVAAGQIAQAINNYSPSGSDDYTANAVGNVIYVFSPPESGSTANGLTITISVSSVTIVTTTTAFTNGSSQNGIYDTTFGARFWIDADYGPTGTPGGGTATPTSLLYAYEITEYFVLRGLQAGIITLSATISNDSINGLTRSCAITQILVSNQGGGPTDVLAFLQTSGFVVGDEVQLIAGTAGQVPTIESAPTTTSPVATPNIYLTDNVSMALNGYLCLALQLRKIPSIGLAWVETGRSIANIGVSSWNGLTGVVSANTGNLPSTTNLRYVTDNQQDALQGTTGIPSNTNRYVTDSDPRLAGGSTTYNINITGGYNLVTGYGDGVHQVGGTGASRTLNILGYSDAAANAQWPLTAAAWGGITANATEYDEVALQEALLTLAQTNYLRDLSAGTGILNIRRGNIIWPSYKASIPSGNDSKLFVFDGQGCLFNCIVASAYVFTSDIPDQTTAKNLCLDNVWRIQNFKIEGQGSGTGMRIGASRNFQLENVHFKNFDVGFQGGLLLNAAYMNCTTNLCNNYGFYIDKGWWTGAGYSTAGNQVYAYNCRFRTNNPTEIGLYIVGGDSTLVQRCTFEGSGGNYGLYVDTDVTTVSKNINVDTCHFELDTLTQYVGALVGVKAYNMYTVRINQLYWQTDVPDTVLLELYNTQGTNHAVIENCIYSLGSNPDRWKFKNINNTGNGAWIFKNTFIQGNPQTPAQVVDTVNFPNVWAAGSDIPPVGRIQIEPRIQ